MTSPADLVDRAELLAELGEGMGHTSVEVETRGPGDDPERARPSGIVPSEHGGSAEAVHDDGVRSGELDELLEALDRSR